MVRRQAGNVERGGVDAVSGGFDGELDEKNFVN